MRTLLTILFAATLVACPDPYEQTEVRYPFEADPTAAPGARFGYAVSIWGNHALVGSPFGYRSGAQFPASGEVDFYRWVSAGDWSFDPVNGSKTWSQSQTRCGFSVDMSNEVAIAGCPQGNPMTWGAPGISGPGFAVAYELDPNGTTWSSQPDLINPSNQTGDMFGASVASNLSTGFFVVGAPGYDAISSSGVAIPDAGAVYVFTWMPGGWVSEMLVPSTVGADHRFGFAVDIDDGSGNTIVVGAPGANTAYIFERDHGASAPIWQETAILSYPTTIVPEQFGWSVSIATNFAVVGAPFIDAGTEQDRGGAAIFWRYDPTNSWGWVERLTFPRPNGRFGHAVSILVDEWIIVGAPGVDDNIADSVVQPGVALVYRQNTVSDWPLHRMISATQPESYAEFGWSVDIGFTAAGINAVVGAPYHDGDPANPITDVGIVEFSEKVDETP